ncbi:DUF1771-domain-containing protein [Viridothelium virens]|uniref:DUF1771-domain-containing protein n=1 Tax=Viridothelium virens TaxID=1048519 RepID=A0A6A6H100_VIRVR|nr:DUF1771-domain-containing protein [Viridothelium virens]
MSYPSAQLGGRPFNHQSSNGAEAEYDRLRDLARQEHGKQQSCAAKSRQAYERGDGAAAHQLSEEGKRHAQMTDQYNKQASEFIFRENNAEGRVASDTIDLHGQFVEEAEQILEQRIRYAQSTGQTHLHVIVGKGNHSPNHIQKIKPRVEEICRELGLSEHTEHNEGRIYIDLTGAPAQMPPNVGYHPQYGGQQQYYDQYSGGGGYSGQGGQPNQNDELEEAVKKNLPKIFKALRSCCVVM